MIEWNENYKLGIEKIDKQHEFLMDYINKLIEIHEMTQDKNAVATVFIGLIHYFVYHFEHEEMVMQECNYPGLERRCFENDIFCNNLERAKLDYMKGDISSLSYIIDYIKIWIMDHIMIEDKKYVGELSGKF
ncbi:MAG: bacteriohemerythrin [Spirochaetia bacterium]|nr:bacteriohemerythrin [Spirochaetia bacterium]